MWLTVQAPHSSMMMNRGSHTTIIMPGKGLVSITIHFEYTVFCIFKPSKTLNSSATIIKPSFWQPLLIPAQLINSSPWWFILDRKQVQFFLLARWQFIGTWEPPLVSEEKELWKENPCDACRVLKGKKVGGKSVWMEVKKKGLIEGGPDWLGFGGEGTGVR